MSPIRSSATRMLLSTMSMMSWQISPRRTSLTGGRRRPSCTISVAVAEKPPGTMPPMAGIRQIAPQAAAIIEGPHHLDVHQVGAAEIGVVDQDHIARLEVAAALDDGLGGELHDPDKNRQPEFALGDDLPRGAIVDAV